MSLYEIYQPSRLHFNNVYPFCMDDDAGEYTFSPPLLLTEDSPDMSSCMQYLETIFSDEYMEFPAHANELHPNSATDDFSPTDDFLMDFDEFDCIFNGDEKGVPESLKETEESGENHRSQESSSDGSPWKASLVLPFEDMEVDNQLSLIHLLMAYAEAMDSQETELSEMIAQSIIQRVNPTGATSDRLLYYMFQHLSKQSDYLKQEATKNFYPAFKAFYQMFPYGKFAHFVAILAILEAMPSDVEIIHIIDLDIGEGLQWATFLEAIKHQQKEIRLTSAKLIEEDETSALRWKFEETKRRLSDHAWSCGLKMEVEEVVLQDLESVIKNNEKGHYGRKTWYVFNCNMGLPHVGRVRSRKDVFDFLRVAKNFLHNVTCCEGIITYGDGETWHNATSCMSYSSFLDGIFRHYGALLESMEFNFPSHLGDARTCLECLFVAPYVSSMARGRKWEDRKQCGELELEFGVGLEGWRFSEASLAEAKEMGKGMSPYGVRIEGEKKNEMVMDWNGIPMVRICCWKS